MSHEEINIDVTESGGHALAGLAGGCCIMLLGTALMTGVIIAAILFRHGLENLWTR